jgi:hypothetical protein
VRFTVTPDHETYVDAAVLAQDIRARTPLNRIGD